MRPTRILAVWAVLGACAEPEPEWEPETTYLCSATDEKRLEDVVRVNATPDLIAVEATGTCRLELVNVDLTSDYGVKANGNAVITIRGGRIHGNKQTLQALGNGRIVVEGATIEGPSPIGRAGKGQIEGVPQ